MRIRLGGSGAGRHGGIAYVVGDRLRGRRCPVTAIGDEAIASITFAQSAPGKAYAVSRTGQVFRKDDVNDDSVAPDWTPVAQWSSPTSSDVRQVAVSAHDFNRIYLITAREIVRWTPVSVSIAPSDAGVPLCAESAQIGPLRSTARGRIDA